MITETDQQILEAARKEFQEKGYNGARMQNIADLAGISKPALHYYFRTKENLFQKIFDATLEEYLPMLNTWKNDALNWQEKIELFVDSLLKYVQEGHMLFLVREINRNPELLAERIKKAKSLNVFVAYFEDLVSKGKVKKVDVKVLYIMLHSVCSFPVLNKQMFQMSLRISEKQYDELMQTYAKSVAEILINAIKK